MRGREDEWMHCRHDLVIIDTSAFDVEMRRGQRLRRDHAGGGEGGREEGGSSRPGPGGGRCRISARDAPGREHN